MRDEIKPILQLAFVAPILRRVKIVRHKANYPLR